MTQGPDFPDPNQPPEGQPAPPPYGAPQGQQPPPYGAPYGQQPPPYGAPQPPPYGAQQPPVYGAPGVYGASAAAPYGIHPVTGIPYSEKTKLVAGLLQILIPLGIGRFYIGDTKIGVWQLVVTIVTCGIGGLWPFIDGIIILATDSVDSEGRPLRTS
jgi:hypothetical protein